MENRSWTKILLVALVIQLTILTGISFGQGPRDFHPRPSPGGVSMGPTPTTPFIMTGTGGMRVMSLTDPNIKFILSNAHVFDAAPPSLCPNTNTPGGCILQPGTLDLGFDPGCDPTYLAGIFIAGFPIDFSGAPNIIDAALAFTVPELMGPDILMLGVPTQAVAIAEPGMTVVKTGRTTGLTSGIVQSVNTTVNVNYGDDCGTAQFIAQVIVEGTAGNFSAGGDSGSVVLDQQTNTPVGLLFAGGGNQTVMNHILFVYILFQVFPG